MRQNSSQTDLEGDGSVAIRTSILAECNRVHGTILGIGCISPAGNRELSLQWLLLYNLRGWPPNLRDKMRYIRKPDINFLGLYKLAQAFYLLLQACASLKKTEKVPKVYVRFPDVR